MRQGIGQVDYIIKTFAVPFNALPLPGGHFEDTLTLLEGVALGRDLAKGCNMRAILDPTADNS